MSKPAFCVDEMRAAGLGAPADTLTDGTFQHDTAACLDMHSSVAPSFTDLEENDGDHDWDWTDDRPTPMFHDGPPPAPLTCEREGVAARPFQRATDHAASACKGHA